MTNDKPVYRYYERHFGSVQSRYPTNAQFLILMLALLVMIFFGRAVGGYVNSVVPEVSNAAHRMISDPDHRANLHPILLWSVLLIAGVSRRPRALIRLSMVFYWACLLVWTGVLAFLPIRYPEVIQQTLWRIVNAGWLGISMILLGLYDHLTLVRLLPRKDHTNDDE